MCIDALKISCYNLFVLQHGAEILRKTEVFMRITIREIADMAQVSRGTVDRVIHDRYGVDPKIRTRVLEIMEQLNYTPNAMARALKGTQNPIRIGCIVPSRVNPFYSDIHAGIDEASRYYAQYGIEVVKLEMECSTSACLIDCMDRLETEGVRGMMLVPIADDEVRERINRLPDAIPIITYNSDIAGTNRMCFVGNDHLAAGRVAGQLMGLILPEHGSVLLDNQPARSVGARRATVRFPHGAQQVETEPIEHRPGVYVRKGIRRL